MRHKTKPYGFTLIELLITMTIVGILVAIAAPSYQNYTRRARYTEIVQAASSYKIGVEECFIMSGDLNSCKGGQNGVPNDTPAGKGSGLIDSITVASGGKIIIAPRDKYGIKQTDTYELTPKLDNEQISWKSGGNAIKEGYAN